MLRRSFLNKMSHSAERRTAELQRSSNDNQSVSATKRLPVGGDSAVHSRNVFNVTDCLVFSVLLLRWFVPSR